MEIFDYIIVGGGAAGMQLVLAMLDDKHFATANILLIESAAKDVNDKTWSYWEEGKGRFDDLLWASYDYGKFYTKGGKLIDLTLNPYRYKVLHSIDVYQYVYSIFEQDARLTVVNAKVTNVTNQEQGATVSTQVSDYQCKHCFDSRVEECTPRNAATLDIKQHFKGYYLQFDKPVFNPDKFTMMDYRLRHADSTSFTYVLPRDERTALVEFTLFDSGAEVDYDTYLRQYIDTYLQGNAYTILSTEQGVIPMTNYPFHKANRPNVTKIGQAGSWIRASSGYSFKLCGLYVNQIINNIKSGKHPQSNLLSKRHRWYDSILLDILHRHNHLGPDIFAQMFENNSSEQIFKFLDGTTTLFEDVKMILSLPIPPFLRAAVRRMVGKYGYSSMMWSQFVMCRYF